MKYFFWPARSGTPSLLRRRQSALPCLIRRAVFHMISAGLLSICVLLGFLNYVSHASFFLPNYLIVLVLVCCSPVVGCRNLSDKEWFSRQDPYVVVEYANNRFRTRTDTGMFIISTRSGSSHVNRCFQCLVLGHLVHMSSGSLAWDFSPTSLLYISRRRHYDFTR